VRAFHARARARIRLGRRRELRDVRGDLVHELQDRVDDLARGARLLLAQWLQDALDRVREVGNLGMLHHARRALQGVREAQQLRNEVVGQRLALEIERALSERLAQLTRLDAEILVEVAVHPQAAAPG